MRKFLATLLLAAVPLMSQLNRGALTGTVTDASGAVIPQVKITIKNTATQATYETVCNDSGQYNMPNLPPGPYQVVGEAPNFKRLVRSGVTLGATQVLRVDLALEIGAVAESVSVTAEAPRLQTEVPEVGTSLSNKQLVDLPLSFSGARMVESFTYKITPGVSGGIWTSHINGSAAFSKDVLLDGASTTTYLAGDFSASSVSVESIAEFKVQTSGMSAEFGRSQAGIFNFVMKSGSNDVHGSFYGALRNEALNANSFANNARGLRRPMDRKQNVAMSLGGPVVIPKVFDGHNRTFFHTTYERYRERNFGFGSPNRTVPIAEFYDGDFSQLLGPVIPQRDALDRTVYRGAIYDPATFRRLDSGRYVGEMFPGNKIPVSRFSEVSKRVIAIARKHYLPTGFAGQAPLTNNAVFPAANAPAYDNHQFSTKVDQNLGNEHKLSGSFSYTIKDRWLLADAGGIWDPREVKGGPFSRARSQRLPTWFGRVAHDWIVTPRMLNHLTVFYNRMENPTKGVFTDELDGARELGIKGLSTKGYPEMNWGGGPFVNLTQIGQTTNVFMAYTGFGLLETVSFSKGRHFMKAGVDIRRNHMNSRATPGGGFNFHPRATAIPNEAFSGNLTGFSMASFLLGIVDSASLDDPVVLGGRRAYYGAFFQDDFKVSDRLTLQLGVRWEYQPPFTEAADRISSWNPNKLDPASGLRGAYDFAGKCDVCTGNRYFGSRTLRSWGPRIGFAYRASAKWTVRGAYGIFYEGDVFNGFSPTPLGKATNVQVGGTWALSADAVRPWAGLFNWDAGFPTDRFVPPSYDVSWGNQNRPGMIDPKYGQTPYVQQWNLNLQREFGRQLVLDIGYVGNKATGLRNENLAVLNQLPASVLGEYGRGLNNAVRTEAEARANGIAYPFPGFQGTVASALRAFPQVQGNQTVAAYGSPLGFSSYNSLQVTVDKRFSGGLTAYANYVWSKILTNTSSSMVSNNSGPLDYYNLKLEKSLAGYDIPHMFKAYVDYELPVGSGKALWTGAGRAANAIFGGWSVSAIMNYFSGGPLGFGGSSPLSGGWNGATNRANIAPGEMKVPSFDKSAFDLLNRSAPGNMYLNKSLFSDPEPLTLGTSAPRYGQARGFGTISEDFGLQKNHRWGERYRIQLRAEFLNFFNRSAPSSIQTNVVNADFGRVVGVANTYREVQLGLRFDF